MAIVIDESHVIKNIDSQLSKALVADRRSYPIRLIATGGPDPLGLQDYYAQMFFLDPNIIGVKNFFGFRNMFCRLGGYQSKSIVGYQRTEELHHRMSPYVHVGAPEIEAKQLFEMRKFSLSKEQRKFYDSFKLDLFARMDNGEVLTAASMLAARVKLQQIACGRVLDADGNVVQLHNERMEVLKSTLKSYEGQSCIIWNRFVADMEAQHSMLPNSEVINGKTSMNERTRIIAAFKNGDFKQLIASPGAAGAGLNLQNTCYLNIYYSNSDNAQHRWQSEARTYRRGTLHNVMNVDIVARSTVDVNIANNYRNKKSNSDMSSAEFRMLIDG